MRIEELKRLWATDAKAILTEEVALGKNEYDVISNEIDKMSTIRIKEREITLPGMTAWKPLLLKVVANFKDQKKRSVMPRYLATSDEITVEPLRPEVFGEVDYTQTISAVGTFDIVPKGASGSYDVKDDEIIVITDAVDYNPAGVVTAIQGVDIDGESYNPLEFRASARGTDLHLVDLAYPFVCDRTLDLDGKVELLTDTTADTELTPVGMHVCLGALLPALYVP